MFDIENIMKTKLTPDISLELWLQSNQMVESDEETKMDEEVDEDSWPLDCWPKWNLFCGYLFITSVQSGFSELYRVFWFRCPKTTKVKIAHHNQVLHANLISPRKNRDEHFPIEFALIIQSKSITLNEFATIQHFFSLCKTHILMLESAEILFSAVNFTNDRTKLSENEARRRKY